MSAMVRVIARRRAVPIALQAIRPMVAGIDVGSREHWSAVPLERTESPTYA